MNRGRDRITSTSDGRKSVVWRLDSAAARILRLELREADLGQARLVECADAPDLATARERWPEHTELWDRLRDDRLAAVFDTRDLPDYPETER